jgi:hypothetical protein
MRGRLETPIGFTPEPWRGLGTREKRQYLLYSLAGQPNQARDRATALLLRQALRTIASGMTPRVVAGAKAHCQHDRFFYEDCERCVEDYAASVLALAIPSREGQDREAGLGAEQG